MIKKLFPHPLLTIGLTLIWVGLAQSWTLNSWLFGLGLAVMIPIGTAPFWPNRPTLKNPFHIAEYMLVVLWDIIVANIEVALIVVFKRNADIKSEWISIPLEVTSPEAITVLAGTITMTPGTVTAMISADGRSLLVHCLHTTDPADVVKSIKNRYERRLLKAFK